MARIGLGPRQGWPGMIGACLIIISLLRWSIDGRWDHWCTVYAAVGAVFAVVWAVRARALLQRGARSRGARFGFQTLVSAALLIAALGFANFVAGRHNKSFDLTESGLFTLAPQSQKVAHSLTSDVQVLAFFPAGRRAQAQDLLRRYADLSPHFRYEMIDPDQDPERAQKYGVTAYGTTVVLPGGGGTSRSQKPIRIEPETGQGQGLSLSEEKLTNAIVKATRGGSKVVYFLAGHGEGDTESPALNGYSRVRSELEGQAFVVKPLVLTRLRDVPADCSILAIAGPSSTPLPTEMGAISRYLERGGKMLLLLDPAPATGMPGLLGDWSLKTNDSLVIDPSTAGRLYGNGPGIPVVTDYDARSPITRDFRLMTLFPLARPLFPKDLPGDAAVMPLAQTGHQSLAQPRGGSAARSQPGPFLVAAAVTRQAKNGKEARLVVVGTSNLVSNAFIDRAGNRDFFMACVNWLAEQEDLIAIQPRPRQDRRVQLTDQQVREVFWLIVVGLPGVTLILGVVVYRMRR